MANYSVTDGQNQSFNLLYSGAAYAVGYNTIDASGTATMAVYVDGQENNTINLAPNARISTTINTKHSSVAHWDIKGDATSLLIASGTSDLSSSTTNFYAPVGGDGTFLSDTNMNVYGPVAASVTFEADGGTISLFNDATFTGNVTLRGGSLNVLGTETITDYSYINGVATFYGGADDHQIASFHLTDGTPGTSPITFGSGGGPVTVQDGPLTSYETALPAHVAPEPPVVTNPPPVVTQPDPQPPAAAQYVSIHDTTTNADLPDTFSGAYSGPVSGISTQTIAITPDSLNVTALTPGAFIKTGGGNDAIAVRGGVNVVDGGAGSNFLTGGDGFDTFFLDARNIPAAASAAGSVPGSIWNSIQEFSSGDAVTLWGVGRAAALSWQGNQGAAGHTGVTLHANKANGTEASLTFAGIDSKAGVSLSYGQSGGVDYLYVKAV